MEIGTHTVQIWRAGGCIRQKWQDVAGRIYHNKKLGHKKQKTKYYSSTEPASSWMIRSFAEFLLAYFANFFDILC
jgi:hypothetical protein